LVIDSLFRQPVSLAKAYRLLNHGPTVLVTSSYNGRRNVMAAAWNMALNFEPAQVAVVIDKSTVTRELVEASGKFALNVPARAIASQVLAVGRTSARELDTKVCEDKFAAYGLQTFIGNDQELPHVEGCVAWLECKVIPEPHIQKTYDLFLGEVTAAWADSRVFSNGHWTYDANPPSELQTLHYVAGGTFLAVADSFESEPAKRVL
jgi:flavin reductase (DIM6/NTAB) family NADH-FMN oxidoreductase RutF